MREKDYALFFCVTDLLKAQKSKTRVTQVKNIIKCSFNGDHVVEIFAKDCIGRYLETTFISEEAAIFIINNSRTKQGFKLKKWLKENGFDSTKKTGMAEMALFMEERRFRLEILKKY